MSSLTIVDQLLNIFQAKLNRRANYPFYDLLDFKGSHEILTKVILLLGIPFTLSNYFVYRLRNMRQNNITQKKMQYFCKKFHRNSQTNVSFLNSIPRSILYKKKTRTKQLNHCSLVILKINISDFSISFCIYYRKKSTIIFQRSFMKEKLNYSSVFIRMKIDIKIF